MGRLWLLALAAGCRTEDLVDPRRPVTTSFLPPESPTSPTASPPGEGATQVGSEGTECSGSTIASDPLAVLLFWPFDGASGVPVDTELLFSPQAPLDEIVVEVSIGGVAVPGRTDRLGVGVFDLVRFVPEAPLPPQTEVAARASAQGGYREMEISFSTGTSPASEPGEVRLVSVELLSELEDLRQLSFGLDIRRSAPAEFATVRVQAEDCGTTSAEILALGRLPEDANDVVGYDYWGRGPDTDCFCAVIRGASGAESEPSDLLCLGS